MKNVLITCVAAALVAVGCNSSAPAAPEAGVELQVMAPSGAVATPVVDAGVVDAAPAASAASSAAPTGDK